MSNLTYRPIDKSYADNFLSIWGNIDVIRYTSIPHPCTIEEIKDKIQKFMQYDVFVVINDTDVIGIVGCPCVDRDKLQFGLFYQFKKSVWGNGYATAAVKWILNFMTEKYEKPTIFADVLTANTASNRILMNYGFKISYQETIIHKGNDETIHHYIWSE